MTRAFVPVLLLAALCLSRGSSAQLGPPLKALHPTQRMRVLVPAYFYPLPGSPWVRLTAAAAEHPGLVWAIGNPDNGPGTAIDASYTAAFAGFRAQRGRLIGYVHTSYGDRPLAEVSADVERWFAWYGADGIFVDEMDNVPGAHESYYRALYQHVAGLSARALVVGNPGTSSTLDYLDGAGGRCASALCLFEGSTGFASYAPEPWVLTRSRNEFYALPYGTGPTDWQAAIDHAFAAHFGWVYVTDDVLPNPWDTLPAYFETMLEYVELTF